MTYRKKRFINERIRKCGLHARMRRILMPLSSTFIFLVCIALISMQNAADIYFSKSGDVEFVSNAQLEKIEATNQNMEVILNRSDKTISFQVPISAFTGFNSDLQHEHFNKNYMEIDQYESASFAGKIIEDVDLKKAGSYKVRAKGMLNIHGIEVERVVPGTILVKDGAVSIAASFEIPLNDHGIKTPRIVNQKIAESVEVSVNVDLKQKSKY